MKIVDDTTTRHTYTGETFLFDGVGPFLDLQGVHHFTLRDCCIRRPPGSGPLVAVSGGRYDSCFLTFDNCVFDGGCLELYRALSVVVHHCTFVNSNYGIIARGGVNGLTVHGRSTFYGNELGAIAALGLNQSWTVSGNVFENLRDGKAGAFINGYNSAIESFEWSGNWHGDVYAPGQAWIDNAFLSGYAFSANLFTTAGENTPMVRLNESTDGTFLSNRFDEDPQKDGTGKNGVGISFGPKCEAVLMGNRFQCRTPIVGTPAALKAVQNRNMADR